MFSLVIWLLNTNNHPLVHKSDSVETLFTLHYARLVGDEVFVMGGVSKLGKDESRPKLEAQDSSKSDGRVFRRFLSTNWECSKAA